MRFSPSIIACACALLALGGCRSTPTLVGDWTGSIEIPGAKIGMDFSFSADGTLAMTQSAGGRGSTVKGPYKELEKTFIFTPTSVESPNMDKKSLDVVNAQMAKTKTVVTFNLEWKDADTISVAQQGAPAGLDKAVTLKRKK